MLEKRPPKLGLKTGIDRSEKRSYVVFTAYDLFQISSYLFEGVNRKIVNSENRVVRRRTALKPNASLAYARTRASRVFQKKSLIPHLLEVIHLVFKKVKGVGWTFHLSPFFGWIFLRDPSVYRRSRGISSNHAIPHPFCPHPSHFPLEKCHPFCSFRLKGDRWGEGCTFFSPRNFLIINTHFSAKNHPSPIYHP